MTSPINEADKVVLRGDVYPLAHTGGAGAAPAGLRMEHMILLLQPDSSQESTLDQLIQQQHDPKSPLYGKFLSPQDFGSQFGVSSNDISKVQSWLLAHGFTMDEIPAGRRLIVFSGTSDQVAAAFNTNIRTISINGQIHYANDSDPQVPAALANVVKGIVKLHNFQYGHSLLQTRAVARSNTGSPQFTYGSSHYLAPADYATIYDINPLYSAGINGAGQSIAIVGRSNINVSDVQSFRSEFGLSARNPTVVIVDSDPGVNSDAVEATLDTEWSGAVAPKANIKLVIASSTNTADGVDLSAQYIVNNNVAPIVSLSYGACEAYMGTTELAFYNNLWKQAAAQGITVFVSSGDSGAAGCDPGSATQGSQAGVNGLCSSSYSVCVGGTQFNEGSNPGQYWLPGNNSVMGSAQSYIPEVVWNESALDGGSGLWAGGGGASLVYSKPAWQTGPGVPADGRRDVPDVSLTAAGHDGYLIEYSGGLYAVGGTSASSPSFAGLMALIDQNAGARQGNANANFYSLAAKQASGGAAIFNDVVNGNNSVPGVTGFSAAKGYDLASGLGSVDAAQLVDHWNDQATPALTLAASPTALTVAPGQSQQITLISSTGRTFNSAVSLAASGAPSGVTVSLGSSKIAAPGSGTVAIIVAATKTAAYGTYTLTIAAEGGNLTAKATVQLTVTGPSGCTLASNPATVSITAGQNTTFRVSCGSIQGGFKTPLNLSLRGPSIDGLSVGLLQMYVVPGADGAPIMVQSAQTAQPGTYTIAVQVSSSTGFSQSISIPLVIAAPNTILVKPLQSSVTVAQGSSTQLKVTTIHSGTFKSAVNLVVAGLPSGVTATLSPAAFVSPGDGTTTITLTTSAKAQAGNSYFVVAASGAGVVNGAPIALTVTATSLAKVPPA